MLSFKIRDFHRKNDSFRLKVLVRDKSSLLENATRRRKKRSRDVIEQKTAMIASQIRPNQVNNPKVIEAFEVTPRDAFVPKAMREVAYVDEDIEIAPGRYLMEPMVLARLIELAAVGPEDVVLDIGCGTGFTTALLARLASVVVGLEENAELAARAGEILADLEIESAAVIEGKLNEGCFRQGPYQVILIAGAVEEIPGNILDQLAEGGRLVTVLIKGGVGRGHLILRKGNLFSGHDHFDANLPLLPGFEKEKKFSF